MNKLAIKDLQELLQFFAIEPQQPLSSVIDATQKIWLRPEDFERWHLQEQLHAHRPFLMQQFKKLGMVDAIMPSQKNYDYFLFMGGDLPGVRERMAYMLKLWANGIRAKSIIFLTAQRELDPSHEAIGKIHDRQLNDFACKPTWKPHQNTPKTECDMLKIIFDQADIPDSLAQTTIEFVNTPNQWKRNAWRRANTGDSILEWLKGNPAPGSCLAITAQPLIGYQHAVSRTLLPSNFCVESVGCHAADDVTTAEFLDTLARWLYQEQIRLG